MEKKLYIANWKSHKTASQALEWLESFGKNSQKMDFKNKIVVVCPAFTALSACFSYIKAHNLPILLGAQNVSKFSEGAYTGEVAARHIREFAEFVIIGHSERRTNFLETDKDVEEKVARAKQERLRTIVCVQDEKGFIPKDSDYVAYEPVAAIGTGNPDNPDNIQRVFHVLRSTTGRTSFIYGGSVDDENITSFLNVPHFGGFLVGGASLDPVTFLNLLSQ